MESLPLPLEVTSWVLLLMVIFARLSFLIFFMPGIGEQTVPVRVRLIVMIAIATALAASGIVQIPVVTTLSGFAGLIIAEAIIGLFLGILLRFSIWMLAIVGTLIAQVIGLSQMLGIALETQAQTVTANILSMAGAALLLTMDYHISVIVRLSSLYTEIPVGVIAGLDPMMVVENGFRAFNFAVLLAWPFVAVNLLYNICLGFINKALPSLMVAFVGAPFLIGAGLLLLAVSITTILIVWSERMPDLVGWL